jgi:hypothetical protein
MSHLNRRTLILSSLSLGLTGTSPALAETKDVPVTQVFPLLDKYLSLGANERTHFKIIYKLTLSGASPSDISVILKHKGQLTPITTDKNGLLSPLPSLDILKANSPVSVSIPKGAKIGLNVLLISSLTSDVSYDASALSLSLKQANSGARKAAGLAAALLPELDRLDFLGASSGQVTLSDGQSKPLPLSPKRKDGQSAITFEPKAFPKAVKLTLNQTPIWVEINTKPKKT